MDLKLNFASQQAVTDEYFIDLVLMLASSAKMDMGELPNPFFKSKSENLARARVTVNMIHSLVKKTAGNLTSEEKKVLKTILDDLQATYVLKSNLDSSITKKP